MQQRIEPCVMRDEQNDTTRRRKNGLQQSCHALAFFHGTTSTGFGPSIGDLLVRLLGELILESCVKEWGSCECPAGLLAAVLRDCSDPIQDGFGDVTEAAFSPCLVQMCGAAFQNVTDFFLLVKI